MLNLRRNISILRYSLVLIQSTLPIKARYMGIATFQLYNLLNTTRTCYLNVGVVI